MSEHESENVLQAQQIIRGRKEEPKKIEALAAALRQQRQFRVARKLKEIADVQKARNILRGEVVSEEEKFALAMELKKENRFGLARKLLGRINPSAITDPKIKKIKVGQQRALCTYKDPDLPVDERFTRAFAILKQVDDPVSSTDQETLGLAGAIYKRIWEVDAQKRHLERALAYYMKGYKAKGADSPDYDFGYTGINAAFVQDILAYQEETEAKEAGAVSDVAETRRAEAKKIREDLIATLPGLLADQKLKWLEDQWWFISTIAEAYFGLKRYDEARLWLLKAAALDDIPDWQYASTTRQLAYLAQLHTGKHGSQLDPAAAAPHAAYQALGEFMEAISGQSAAAAVESAIYGKIGLALSGGGLRASLFHIGVLARLAELDLLRRVEVISCVSGGAIVGAHYQLEVRKLLREKSDKEITQQDYIEIVKRMEKEFLEGVQRNIRTRVAAEWRTNLKMVFFPNYSRTKRAGELYERELYSRVPDNNGTKQRLMSDLLIQPVDGPENFQPKYDNWRRVAKVPDLILNATTLNTGHNWQFTASWMGEPPSGINSEIDSNYRLRRLYYPDAPAVFREKNEVRLGDAVGASACVPGLFEPIPLMTLYGETGEEPVRKVKEIVVRLVDGGVHDNQGIASLLEQGCSQLIVSDASGQMDTIDDPSSGLLAVPLRSNSILMSRVREAQYQELAARRRSSLLQGLIFVHLKKDLDADPMDWLDCNDRWSASDGARPPERAGDLTTYGVKKGLQRLLASVRTDLDSFSESEACALMMSGYAMIERAPANEMRTFPRSEPIDGGFRFLNIRDAMSGGAGYLNLMRLLEVSHMRGFKIWKLLKWLRMTAWVLGTVALLGLAWLCWTLWTKPQFQITLGIALTMLLVIVVGTILVGICGPPIQRLVHWRKTPSEFGIGVAMATLGFFAAKIHLWIFDKLFLKYGRLERVTGKAPAKD